MKSQTGRKGLAGVWPWQMEPSGAKHHKVSFLGNLPIFRHTTYTALWLRARLWGAWEGLGASPTHTLIHTCTAPLTQSVLIPSLPVWKPLGLGRQERGHQNGLIPPEETDKHSLHQMA